MSLKTLHLTNAWHKESGGIGTFYRALLDAANERGHYLRLVVPGAVSRVEEAGPFGRTPFHSRSPRPSVPICFCRICTGLLFRVAPLNGLSTRMCGSDLGSEKYTMPYLSGLLRVQSLQGVSSAHHDWA